MTVPHQLYHQAIGALCETPPFSSSPLFRVKEFNNYDGHPAAYYATDKIVLVEAKSVACSDAMLLSACALTAEVCCNASLL